VKERFWLNYPSTIVESSWQLAVGWIIVNDLGAEPMCQSQAVMDRYGARDWGIACHFLTAIKEL